MKRPLLTLAASSDAGHPAGLESVEPFTPERAWSWRRAYLGKMGRFAGPALCVPLADPLMSMIDVLYIGQFTSTTELAALGPVNVIFAFSSYVFIGLGIGTVSLMSEKLAAGTPKEASRVLTTALCFGVSLGVVIAVVMRLAAVPMIAATGAAPELVPHALSYLRIRAIAQPALLALLVCQSGLLAQRDSVSPSAAVLCQVCVNLALDYCLIARSGAGVAGAAWATVASQYLGAATLAAVLRWRAAVKPSWERPAAAALRELLAALAPLSVAYICKNLCYLALQSTATTLRTLELAAHQPVWLLLNVCGFCCSPLEQATIAFLPTAQDGRSRRELIKLLLGIAAALAAALGAVVAGVPTFLPWVFSPDRAVWPVMASVAPMAFCATLLTALDVTNNAILISSKRASSIALNMAVVLAVLLAYLYIVRSRGWGLVGVWWGVPLFFAVRLAQSAAKVARLDCWRPSDPTAT